MNKAFFAVVLMSLLLSCAYRKPLVSQNLRAPKADVAILNVTVFDGEKTLPNQDVWVREGVVAWVGPHGSQAFPKGLEVFSGEGKTLLPGLWDSHLHLGTGNGDEPWAMSLPNTSQQLEALLYAGITHAFDGGRDCDSTSLLRDIESGKSSGPHLLRATRLYTAPKGHPLPLLRALVPWPLVLLVEDSVREVFSEADGVQKISQDLKQDAPDFLKIVYNAVPEGTPHLSREMLAKLIAHAHALGLRAAVHVGSAKEAVEAAEAGADVLMHVPWEDVLTEEDARRIAQTGVLVTSTRRIYALAVELPKKNFKLNALEKSALPDHPGTFRPMPKNYVLPAFPPTYFTEDMPKYHDNIGKNLLKLRQAQTALLAGTDSSLPGIIHGGALHRELEALVELGFANEEVLAMATSRAARLLGRLPSSGRVVSNAQADLVLVEGNPMQDITHTRNIVAVWKAGRKVEFPRLGR